MRAFLSVTILLFTLIVNKLCYKTKNLGISADIAAGKGSVIAGRVGIVGGEI